MGELFVYFQAIFWFLILASFLVRSAGDDAFSLEGGALKAPTVDLLIEHYANQLDAPLSVRLLLSGHGDTPQSLGKLAVESGATKAETKAALDFIESQRREHETTSEQLDGFDLDDLEAFAKSAGGSVTLAEAMAAGMSETQFRSMDTDNSGTLDEAEFTAWTTQSRSVGASAASDATPAAETEPSENQGQTRSDEVPIAQVQVSPAGSERNSPEAESSEDGDGFLAEVANLPQWKRDVMVRKREALLEKEAEM